MNPAGDLTLGDLMLQLGIRVGVRDQPQQNDNRFTLPADPATRQLLMDAINSGRRELYNRMPDARAFQPMVSLTLDPAGTAANVVDSDPSKYRLAYNVEGFAGGQFEFYAPDDDGTPSGLGGIIRQVHQSDLAAAHTSSLGQTTSWPRSIALARVMLGNPAEPGRKVVDYLWIFPKPDQAYVITGQVRIGYGALTELDDLEPMGQQHIESVLTFAERAWYIGRCPAEQWALLEQRAKDAVIVSTNLDNVRGPQNLGVNTDPDAERDQRKYRMGSSVPQAWSMVNEASGQSVL